MAVISLSSDSFENASNRRGVVLVDCWAEWCQACEDFAPVFEKIAAKYPHHTFSKVNTEIEKDLVERLGVKHIPSLLLFRDGILLFQQAGYFDEEGLESIIDQADSLDMEMVRKDIASANSAEK